MDQIYWLSWLRSTSTGKHDSGLIAWSEGGREAQGGRTGRQGERVRAMGKGKGKGKQSIVSTHLFLSAIST